MRCHSSSHKSANFTRPKGMKSRSRMKRRIEMKSHSEEHTSSAQFVINKIDEQTTRMDKRQGQIGFYWIKGSQKHRTVVSRYTVGKWVSAMLSACAINTVMVSVVRAVWLRGWISNEIMQMTLTATPDWMTLFLFSTSKICCSRSTAKTRKKIEWKDSTDDDQNGMGRNWQLEMNYPIGHLSMFAWSCAI